MLATDCLNMCTLSPLCDVLEHIAFDVYAILVPYNLDFCFCVSGR